MTSTQPPTHLAAASISNAPETPVVPLGSTQQGQPTSQVEPPKPESSIVLAPNVPATSEQKPAPISSTAASSTAASEKVDPCCSNAAAIGFLALGLIMFLIFVTIAGQLGQSDTIFCNGYWRKSQKYQFSGHSIVAVWALLQGSTFFFLGLLCVLENVAASRKAVALRDQLRTLLLLTGLFFVAWMIAGNVWIIGDEANGGLGVVPIECKEGNMGNRNLYHFCLALLIFMDIMVPITLIVILVLTSDLKTLTLFNKTLLDSSPTPASDSTSSAGTDACCTLPVAAGSLVLGLSMFLIFVTIAGVLGQDSTVFCNGYWKADVKYQLSGHSTVAVWALLQGSTFFFLGLLWVLESWAASKGAIALRDRLRTILLLTSLFFISWLIAGNVWILGDVNSMGVVPDDCKHGNNGNRNLYHFCYVIIILLDIALPLVLFPIAAYTIDFSSSTICVKTLFQAQQRAVTPATPDPYRQTYPCCSLGVSLTTFAFSLALFVIFITIPSVMEPGTMSHSWDQHFCNGYWTKNAKYQISGHSAVAVWALLQGATFLLFGVLWILENRAAVNKAFALRDQLRTLLLLTTLFGIAWMIAGNAWIIGDETTGSKLGVIPQECKDGAMGNRNLYHFCLAILIFMDITVPLALIAVVLRSSLTRTLSLYPFEIEKQPAAKVIDTPNPTTVKSDDIIVPSKPDTSSPADMVYVGQA